MSTAFTGGNQQILHKNSYATSFNSKLTRFIYIQETYNEEGEKNHRNIREEYSIQWP